jgi:hypothetical protein
VTTTTRLALMSFCGLALAASCTGPGLPPPKERAIFVYLTSVSGECTPIMGTVPVEVYQGDTVVWDVLNDCDGDADVEAADFTMHGQPTDPFDEKDKTGKVNRKSHRPLKFKIRDTADTGQYKYAFAVANGGRLDPELVVDGRRR